MMLYNCSFKQKRQYSYYNDGCEYYDDYYEYGWMSMYVGYCQYLSRVLKMFLLLATFSSPPCASLSTTTDTTTVFADNTGTTVVASEPAHLLQEHTDGDTPARDPRRERTRRRVPCMYFR